MTEFCTKKEIAVYLKVTERTIDRLRKNGLPCIKIHNKILRFDKEDILRWLKLNSQDAVNKLRKVEKNHD